MAAHNAQCLKVSWGHKPGLLTPCWQCLLLYHLSLVGRGQRHSQVVTSSFYKVNADSALTLVQSLWLLHKMPQEHCDQPPLTLDPWELLKKGCSSNYGWLPATEHFPGHCQLSTTVQASHSLEGRVNHQGSEGVLDDTALDGEGPRLSPR